MEQHDHEIIDDPTTVVSDPRLHQLYAYLKAKRGARNFASWRDINPVEIPHILAHAILVDVFYDPLRFQYRLIGSAVVNWRGYDLTGTFIHDHPSPQYREAVLDACRKTIELRAATGGVHRTFLDGMPRYYEIIRVPLSDDDVTINKIFSGVIVG